MRRRTVLGLAAALSSGGLAGCAGDGDSGRPSPTPTETREQSTVAEATLTVREIADGHTIDQATVSVQADGPAIVVEGIIWGSDGCKTATLETVEYDAGRDTLRVAVTTTDREDAGDVCTETVVEIDYRVRVALTGALPGTVAVTHDGRAVTTADPKDG
jgi:hypothetical protein